MKINLPEDRFIPRDISWLQFNARVLEEATDSKNPLFERLRFVAIFFNNLDEFLAVRLATCLRVVESGYHNKDQFGWYPHALAGQIYKICAELINNAYDIVRKKLVKELEKNNIFIKNIAALNNEERRYIHKYFESTVYPVITPIAVDQGHPFPVLPSKSICFAVRLKRRNKKNFALIPVPDNLPRLLALPSRAGEFSFIVIEDVIRENIQKFFRGYQVQELALFRVLRDSELYVEEAEEANMLKAIEKEVRKRPRAQVVSVQVEDVCPQELLGRICEALAFPQTEVIRIKGNVDLTYLFAMIDSVPRPDLLYPSFMAAQISYDDIFTKMNEGEMMLHIPFQSFKPTIDFLRAAAEDPDVLAIKMTLYRASDDSAIIKALKKAVENKKQVTILVEIKARFDEERNIRWVRELEDVGCHVIYGIVGIKIHSKIALIIRREGKKIKRYVHLSTGNYNERTALVYTDCGFFTANDDFAKDISDVFNVITGYSVPTRWKNIMSSPYDLREYFFQLIEHEIVCQKKYKNGFIFAKMNSLEDTKIIDKLYEASQHGVRIQLLIRGICSLVPGVAGLSETVEVRSIVGRFLEHSRIYLFNNNGTKRVFMSSADFMRRNFDRRIELLFEMTNQNIKDHLEFMLQTYWKDNTKARVLGADKQYQRVDDKEKLFNAQEYFMQYYAQST